MNIQPKQNNGLIKVGILPPDRYWMFRSPHSNTIACTANGGYLVACFAGTYEKHPDTAIWLNRHEGDPYEPNDWVPPVCVANLGPVPHWNPVLFDPTPGSGELWLFFKVGHTIATWQTWYIRSTDDGRTWSQPAELVPDDASGGRGPVKNKPIVLNNGDWLAPASSETGGEANDRWAAFADIRTDQGKTWTKSNNINFADTSMPGMGVIQPTVWESRDGHVHMLLRSTCGWVCKSDSKDHGRTWSQATPIDIPNPNSGIDLVKRPDGRLFLVCNPDPTLGRRTPLSVFTSSDNADSWKRCIDLEDEDVNVGHLHRLDGGEFSYPSVINDGDNITGVYTIHRKQIGFWRAPAAWLVEQSERVH